eukprot:CAMPEP_0117427014 /NCGR_PEP_ID=MMETSP0758-20121206/6968_1 /TAXON_ID=63605 /ORGANISM="Percolomonas cosmopolitus, Strain AE-1 (ATCC 50343)" /LENGTH=412 /DNA_ID=CAMNT_0005212439 /DNA_START=177 /DNA_END=1415 /DNA_ORIENTATION=+
MLRRFIEQNSTAGNEQPMQNIIASYFKSLGATDLYTIPISKNVQQHAAFSSPHSSFSASNVIGLTPLHEGTGRSLLFNAHIDVVPAEDASQFVPRIVDGDKFMGRGTSDMKGGLFAVGLALEAVHSALSTHGYHLTNRVGLMSVIEEESGGAGSLASCLSPPLSTLSFDAALIPEPTDFKFFPSQQGSLWFRISIPGIAAHGATRYHGVSAIEKIPIVLSALHSLERNRTSFVRHHLSDLYPSSIPIPVPINVGVVRGGKWPSSCPDSVVLEGRMGVIPGENLTFARSQLVSALSSLPDPFLIDHPVNVSFFGAAWPPGHLSSSHPFVSSLHRYFPSSPIEAAPWATDAGYLSLFCHVPSLVFGPGVSRVAHSSSEFISLSSIRLYSRSLASFILDWVGFAPDFVPVDPSDL